VKDAERTLLELIRNIVTDHPHLIPSVERIVLLARRRNQWSSILKEEISIEERFTTIYKQNLWGSRESRSGHGSGLEYTKNLRAQLPLLLAKYQIYSIFDAPCGDLNWMRILLPTLNIDYCGGDIVQEIIEENRKKFGNAKTRFMHMNLLEHPFPQADLMLCRDCLFHFSYQDILRILKNFVASKIPYFLTTTYVAKEKNQDILTGAFRLMNLFEFPFDFSPDPLERIDDWAKPEPERQMCLWTRAEVEQAVTKFEANLSNHPDRNRLTQAGT
jgi:hypothetical protein